MIKPFARRPLGWILVVSFVVLAMALSACGDNGSSSGATTGGNSGASGGSSAATVNVKETKGASGDVYMCDPTSISVKKGDTVTFTNMSDEKQDFDMGDAQKAGVDFVMDLNQSTTATFKTAGTFTIKSEKGATITVTVQ